MGKYNFDEIVDRRNTSSCKWDVAFDELPMWVADMDFSVLPEIQDAIKRRADISAYGYSEVSEDYYLSYQSWWKRHHHVDIDVSDMTFSLGVVASIDSILKHLVPRGSGVVIQSPVYHVFFNCIRNNGHILYDNKLIYQNGDYEMDFDNLERLFMNNNIKAMILCNPHNPVGRIWTEEELYEVVSICERHHVLLISDEIHCDIVENGTEYNSILKVSDNAIALLSPTKAFNIAGIHSSIVVTRNKELLSQIEDGLGMDDVGEPNYFSCDATVAAFTCGDEWIKEMNEYVFRNKRYVQEFIKEELPKLWLVDNEATYLLWLDISAYTDNSDEFAADLRKKTGLFVSPGRQFSEGDHAFIRINIATSLDNVKDACCRLREYIENYTL